MVICINGCGSRKKQKSSEVYIEQVAKKEMENLILKNDTESVETVSEISEQKVDTKIAKFNGTIANPDQPATVEEKTENGVTTRTYRNFITVNTETESKLETKIDSLQRTVSEKNNTIAELRRELEDNSKTEKKTKNLDVERKTGIPWWLWLILALVLLCYGVASYYKKTLNPFGFFNRN